MAETHSETPVTVLPAPANIDDLTFDTPPEPARRPVGRPRGSTKAAPAAPAPAGPAPGEEGGEDPDFFEYIKTFPQSDWSEHLFMYLYRTAPQINLGRRGEWRIEKYARPVDAQFIMENHGSGGYKIMLDRWDPVKNQTAILRTHYFTIVNMNFPPRVPFGEWLDKPENKEWQWAKPHLRRQMDEGGAGNTGEPQSGAALFRAAVEAVKELRPDQSPQEQSTLAQMVITTMQENQRQLLAANNPHSTIELVSTILTALGTNKSEASSPMMALVMGQLEGMRTELAAERQHNRDLLTRMATPSGEPPKSIVDQLRGVKEIAEELGMGRAGVGGPKKTDWGEVGIEVGKELLKSLTAIATAIVTKPNNGRAPQPAPRPAATVQPQLAAPADQTNPAAEPQPQGDAVSTIQALSDQFGGLFDTAAPFLVDQFSKGFSGMEFREWFKETYGSYTYNAIRALDPRTIVDVIELRKQQAPAHVQELLQRLQPAEQVQTFVQEFLSDAPLEDEDDEDPQEPAPAARPAARPARANEEF